MVIEQSPPPTHFAVCATYSPTARDSLPKYFLGLLHYTGEGIQWIWEAGGSWVLQGWPCLAKFSLSFPMTLWLSPASPGHRSLHISGWKGTHGDGQENATGRWQRRGNCGPAAEGGRRSGDNRHGRCWRIQATLDLIIPVQLSFSRPRLLSLTGMSGTKKSYSHWRRPILENI